MILLVAGSTETARELLMYTFLQKCADWKHLAIEDMEEEFVTAEPATNLDEGPVLEIQDEFKLLLACECAKEVANSGHNVVITIPRPSSVGALRASFPSDTIAVYLGTGHEAADFDHMIDTEAHSLKETYAMLEEIVAR